jgi:uncharacterized RDD family membrane protein YckC
MPISILNSSVALFLSRREPMLQPRRDYSLGDGVYFAADDYIGVGRRLLIVCVDTLVLGLMVWVLSSLWFHLVGDYEMFLGVVVFAVWLYLVPLKRSAWRTVGYQFAGAKLVNLKGARPALWLLTLRSLLWLFGFSPVTLLLEFLWCSVDCDRQSLRDRITNICLVKNHAMPIGTGEVHTAYYFSCGYTFAYSHVVHPKSVDT